MTAAVRDDFRFDADDVAVLFTALDTGYQVAVALDASGAWSTRVEEAALRRMEQAGATISSVIGIVMGCAPEFGTPPGSEAFAAVKKLLATRD